MRRTATRDCEIRGRQIGKDDQVLMWYVSANRDEDELTDAEAIDIERARTRGIVKTCGSAGSADHAMAS